jgi:hypothetical protein
MSEYASVDEVNGLGQRMNKAEIAQAQFSGQTSQRVENLEKCQDEHRRDIKELFTSVEGVRTSVTALNGRLVGMGVALSLVIPLVTAVLIEIVFKR